MKSYYFFTNYENNKIPIPPPPSPSLTVHDGEGGDDDEIEQQLAISLVERGATLGSRDDLKFSSRRLRWSSLELVGTRDFLVVG